MNTPHKGGRVNQCGPVLVFGRLTRNRQADNKKGDTTSEVDA
jgi:hypothetical protein